MSRRVKTLRRTLAAVWGTASGAAARKRTALYGDARGLRMATLHHTYPDRMEWFGRLLDWCSAHFEMVGPEAVDRLAAGEPIEGARDQFLLTYDDGCRDTFASAEELARRGLRATFFIIPSYLDRSTEEFLQFHRAQGVEPYPVGSGARLQPCYGLRREQVEEMHRMGHRIAAHNFAHRNLGKLTAEKDLDYEIKRSLEGVAEITGAPCEDFAFGFGHVQHISREAAEYLQRHVKRTYSAVRGLNVAGARETFFVRDSVSPDSPLLYSKAALRGAFDGRFAPMRAKLEVLAEGTRLARSHEVA